MRYTTARSLRRRGGMALVATAGLAASSLVGPAAQAADPVSPLEGVTQWTSVDAGESGGRELPSVSADGRWVAFVGRGEGQGVWLVDRQAGTTRRLTTGMHFNPAVSDDGKKVAFVEYGATRSVKVIDVASGAITTVSLADDGSPASGLSDFPSISRDGRYVAFQSTDKLLDDDVTQPAAGGGPNRAYVRDTLTGDTEMVGVTDGGEASQGSAIKPDISPDGRYVAFAAEAANLLPPAPAAPAAEEEEPTAAQQIYLRDRQAGTTTLVSVGTDDLPGDAISAPVYGPTVSDDGTKVAFESLAANLVADDTNADVDAFVRDLPADTTVRVSLDADGNQVDLPNPVITPTTVTTAADTTAADPMVGGAAAISGDGTVVAFQSEAALTPDDENGTGENLVKDVYAYDLAADTFERVSVPEPGGTEASGTRTDGNTGETVSQTNGADPAIDAHGRHVAFVSNGNLTGDRPIAEEEATTSAEDVSTEAGIFTRVRLGDEGWFVRAVYQDLFDRVPESSGLVYWVESLWRTGDRGAFTRTMVTSYEYRTDLVQQAYQQYLGRAADAGGLSYWTGQLVSGVSIERVRASLGSSAEAYANAGGTNDGFVDYAYQTVLGRAPDAGGKAYWVSRLDSGTSRSSLILALLRSTEGSQLRVTGIFETLLDRAPDAGGLAYWSGLLSTGTSEVTMTQRVLASAEYFGNAEAHLTD